MTALLMNDLRALLCKKSYLLSVVIASPLMLLLFNTASFTISYATFISCLFALASITNAPFFAKEKVYFAFTLSGAACLLTTFFAAFINQYLHTSPAYVLVETGASTILLTGVYNLLALTALLALAFPFLVNLEKRRMTVTR